MHVSARIVVPALFLLAACHGPLAIPGEVAPTGSDSVPRVFAFLVGINKYHDPAVNILHCCAADAKALAETMKIRNGVQPDRLRLLTDDARAARDLPTRQNILAEFQLFCERLGPDAQDRGTDDTLIVFFSGHGYADQGFFYLVPCDFRKTLVQGQGDGAEAREARARTLTEGCVPLAALTAVIEKSRIPRVLILLDACHAGTGKAIPSPAAGPAKNMGSSFAAGKDRLIIASCKPDELSQEMEDRGHGLFTHYLLKGLEGAADKNQDGQVQANTELFSFLHSEVLAESRKRGMPQTPVLHPDPGGDFVVSRVPKGDGQPGLSRAPRPKQEQAVDLGQGVTLALVWVPGGRVSPQPLKPGDPIPGELAVQRGFWMAKYETTNRQYLRFLKATAYNGLPDARGPGEQGEDFYIRHLDPKQGYRYISGEQVAEVPRDDDYPVVFVSWRNAQAFATWVGERARARAARLPTAVEWEYACRAGARTRYWWGDEDDDTGKRCNVPDLVARKLFDFKVMDMRDGFVTTAPVGSFLPNAFGLHDMLGNAAEWCQDRVEDGAANAVARLAVKGGSWKSPPNCCTCEWRGAFQPFECYSDLGFRIVLEGE